jgi:hypothetical protein
VTRNLTLRRRPTAWLLAIAILLIGSSAHAGDLKLDRSKKPDKVWIVEGPDKPENRGKPGADAKPIIDAVLKAAGLPEGEANNPWRERVAQYWKLDHMAQGEPRSYTEGKYVPNAWFTHGARHLLDLMILITDNEAFVKELFEAQGMNTAAQRDRAYKDLLIALIGHDSEQLGFASDKEKTREDARQHHPFNGGVATALAYLKDPGTSPAGGKRAMMLALAAAGHSKTAVSFTDLDLKPAAPKFTRGAKVMLADLLAKVNEGAATPIALTPDDRNAIIAEAQKIGTTLGALDSLRERGPKKFSSQPTGVSMEYRVEGTTAATRVLVVYNTRERKQVVALKEEGKTGVEHRTYAEYHTIIESVRFADGRVTIRISFDDKDRWIPELRRSDQAKDIYEDFIRMGLKCTVQYKKQQGNDWGELKN